MSGLEVLSTISAVFELISFGLDVSDRVRKIRDGADINLGYNAEMRNLSENVETVMKHKLKHQWTASQHASEVSRLAYAYLSECRVIREELDKYARAKDQQRSRQILANILNHRKIKTSQEKLRSIRDEFKGCLILLLTDESSKIRAQLDAISEQKDASNEKQQHLVDLMNSVMVELRNEQRISTDALLDRLNELQREAPDTDRQRAIMRSLQYPELKEREDMISKSHQAIFEWAFDDRHAEQDLNLHKWFQQQNGLYWVTGKPGSGKSTFMKHISGHNQTEDALRHWAAGKELVIASFFFWTAGARIQRSQEGLLRSLLQPVFSKAPSLIKSVVPRRWNDRLDHRIDSEWTFEELIQAVKSLVRHTADNMKFCFFIDGLDEYEGCHARRSTVGEELADIAELVQSLASNPNIKVCASSRPWPVFMARFNEQKSYKLEIHKHTMDNIRSYTTKNLEFLTTRQEEYAFVIDEIVQRAEGVWLWVTLAIRDIRQMLENGDSLDELKDQLKDHLDRLPPDLDGFYQRMLDSTRTLYPEHAAKILLGSIYAKKAVPAIAFCTEEFTSLNTFYTSVNLAKNGSISYADSELIRLQNRFNARCKDLLEVRIDTLSKITQTKNRVLPRLVIMHKTAYDFLWKNRDQLMNAVDGDFDPRRALVKAFSEWHELCSSERDNRAALVSFIVDELEEVVDFDDFDKLEGTQSDPFYRLEPPSSHKQLFLRIAIKYLMIQATENMLKSDPWLVGKAFLGPDVKVGCGPDHQTVPVTGPLLWVVIGWHPSRGRMFKAQDMKSHLTRMLNFIGMLLRRGADPNQQVKLKTEYDLPVHLRPSVWRCYLYNINQFFRNINGVERRSSQTLQFIQVQRMLVTLLLDYGADPFIKDEQFKRTGVGASAASMIQDRLGLDIRSHSLQGNWGCHSYSWYASLKWTLSQICPTQRSAKHLKHSVATRRGRSGAPPFQECDVYASLPSGHDAIDSKSAPSEETPLLHYSRKIDNPEPRKVGFDAQFEEGLDCD